MCGTNVQQTDGDEYGFGSGLKPLKRGASAPEGKHL